MQTASTAPAAASPTPLTTLAIPRIGAYWPEHGGDFLGIARGAEGQPDYFLICGPYAPKRLNHGDALSYAKGLQLHGFADWDLPDQTDGKLIDANGRAQMRSGWHWLKPQYARNAAFAWAQYFGLGSQFYDPMSIELEVVLVRRVPI